MRRAAETGAAGQESVKRRPCICVVATTPSNSSASEDGTGTTGTSTRKPANSRTPVMPTGHDPEYCVSIRNPLAGGPADLRVRPVVADARICGDDQRG